MIVVVRNIEEGHPDHNSVEKEALAFQYSMLLDGYGYCSGGVQVSGNTQFDLHIGPISSILPFPVIQGRRVLRVNEEALEGAVALSQTLQDLYKHKIRYLRIRRGLAAWVRGVQEINPEPRLHNFVRSVEALTMPGLGGLTRSFCMRAQLFIGDGKRNYARLKQLYALRSCIEHVKWWRSELHRVRGLTVHDTLLYRALEAELVASFAYRKILKSPTLLRHFASESTVRKFWNLSDPDRRILWGDPINMTGEANRLFLPRRVARGDYGFLDN